MAVYRKTLMDLPDLRLDFYGATIDEANIGPGRELNLAFRDMAGDPHSRVRFGGIANFDDVKAFFETAPIDTLDSLHFLRYDRTEVSKPGDLVIELGFDRTEDRCVIRCSKVAVTDAAEPQMGVTGEL